jgi:hypothetical protein
MSLTASKQEDITAFWDVTPQNLTGDFEGTMVTTYKITQHHNFKSQKKTDSIYTVKKAP